MNNEVNEEVSKAVDTLSKLQISFEEYLRAIREAAEAFKKVSELLEKITSLPHIEIDSERTEI